MDHSSSDEPRIAALRQEHYNAAVAEVRESHSDLRVFRVRPDDGVPEFLPGQYFVLGLGSWEPRVAGAEEELPTAWPQPALIRRAYSVSTRLVDDAGRIVPAGAGGTLEFVIALVRRAAKPPALTPRLFRLAAGDRLHLSARAKGNYLLPALRPRDQVVFAATGTGEAPHNALAAQLLGSGFEGRVASVVCVRQRNDLPYLNAHRRLEALCPNYRYLALTTREPENLDPSRPDYVGKRYLQEYFDSGAFERDAGQELDPARTHVFLCGAPEMIGVPLHTHDPQKRYPQPRGMVEVLEARGFRIDRPHEPGNLHFEKYW